LFTNNFILQLATSDHVIAVVVLLSFLQRVWFHLEYTITSVAAMPAINILITHAVQRTKHSITPVHSAVGFSIAMMNGL